MYYTIQIVISLHSAVAQRGQWHILVIYFLIMYVPEKELRAGTFQQGSIYFITTNLFNYVYFYFSE